ncbi:MAG: AMIN domain-containing protein, partial [Alphaproteobacteria bacterium]
IQQTANVSPASGGMTASASVNRIRFGEHPGKTRMVLDLSGESAYRADINNNERVLMIELDNADWDVARREIMQHPLVAGYSAQPSQAGGTILALKLKKPVRIVGSAALKPNDSRGHRIYLDLASG